jgi:alpha-glucosidase
VKETYPWRGVHSQAVNHCNGATIHLKHARSNTTWTLEARAFNDGIAFRQIVPGDSEQRVPDEATRFVLPAGSTVWYHDLEGHYEGVHDRKDVGEVKAGEWAAPPLTFRLPDGAGYGSLTEAGLVNYAGMALQADGRRGFAVVLGHKHPACYPFRLRYSKEDIERLSRPATVAGTITSPWRVVMVGADLNALVNCDVLHNLCPPPDPKLFPKGIHTEWLKPGRAVWKYLDGGESTLEGMKEFCRLAGELGFEYNVVEGFWRRWSDAELRELVAVGRKNGVAIWLWKHGKELRDPDARSAFFAKCHDLGVAGVKLDFFDHEAREAVDLYQTLLKEAAENQLMVNFHGSNKPTGGSRTWPNELVREAVKGMEASKLQTRARHDATLPFTRFLAGHADYTPVHFGARRGDTTWAHQVATAAVFTAPLLTYAAHPRTLLDNPCAPMIKSIPPVWDETIALPVSEIGEVAAFARRSGDTWYLAVVNGPVARDIRVPLSFLGAGEYGALMIRDRKNAAAEVRVEEAAAQRGDTLAIELNDGGGFIARFCKK